MSMTYRDEQTVVAPYIARTYLHELLDWFGRLLHWQVAVTRHTFGALADDEYRGLYVGDAEVDALSALPEDLPTELIMQRRVLIAERAAISAAMAETEPIPPLLRLARLFDLTEFECDVLLLALAPEWDLRYERLLAYVQDDVTKKRPTVDIALRMLCPDPGDRMLARAAFAPDAPLLRHRLVQVLEDTQRHAPLLARFVKIDERILAELLAQPVVDPIVAPFVALVAPSRSLNDLVLPTAIHAQLRQTIRSRSKGLVLALQGNYGSGRGAIADALCAEYALPLLRVDLESLVASGIEPQEAMERIGREALLRGAALLWNGVNAVLQDERLVAWRVALLALLDDGQGCSFLPLDEPWEARGVLRRSAFLRIELPPPSYTEREQLWRQRLNGDTPDDAALQALASTFRLSGGQIRDAVTMARSLSRWQGGVIRLEDFQAACRAQSSGKLDSLAHKIKTTYAWDDIVLPPDQSKMLQEIVAQVRHRRTVLETWGFERRLAMGKGVNVLFAGPSGTGKTMAAEIIAADLGLELYKVDLSTMVSKFIGETEKNLERIFTAAREANAILFFDEADAIFGKRSEVKDAHDRYANIEVGYLLQKMESYDGVVILATNLRKNLDDAFIRRLHVAIDFPFPEDPDRLRIWQKAFPREAPLADDVDLAFLAKRFKFAGGNIRNIALLSAYIAAETGGPIGMIHIIHAAKREYQKLGKLITEGDFGHYLAAMKRTT